MTTHYTPTDCALLALHGAREALTGMAAARLDAEPILGESLLEIANTIAEAGIILEKYAQTKGD
jgi:hypothetical protein